MESVRSAARMILRRATKHVWSVLPEGQLHPPNYGVARSQRPKSYWIILYACTQQPNLHVDQTNTTSFIIMICPTYRLQFPPYLHFIARMFLCIQPNNSEIL